MSATTADSKAEVIFGITTVTTAGGVLTYALFPFLLPGVVLLAILALPLVPLMVVGAIAYAIFALARGVLRLVRRVGGGSAKTVGSGSDRRAGAASTPHAATGRLGHSVS